MERGWRELGWREPGNEAREIHCYKHQNSMKMAEIKQQAYRF